MNLYSVRVFHNFASQMPTSSLSNEICDKSWGKFQIVLVPHLLLQMFTYFMKSIYIQGVLSLVLLLKVLSVEYDKIPTKVKAQKYMWCFDMNFFLVGILPSSMEQWKNTLYILSPAKWILAHLFWLLEFLPGRLFEPNLKSFRHAFSIEMQNAKFGLFQETPHS